MKEIGKADSIVYGVVRDLASLGVPLAFPAMDWPSRMGEFEKSKR